MEPPSAAVQCYSAPVEVRGYENKWYMALLAGIDLEAKEARISFENNVWQPRIVPIDTVRFVPKKVVSGHSFQPGVGDTVEVLSLGSDFTPPSWCLGTVSGVKDGLYYIQQEPGGGDDEEEERNTLKLERQQTIVELNHLRAPSKPRESPEQLWDDSTKCSPVLTNLKSEIFEVPQSLSDWLVSDDGRACMRYIAVRVRLASISVQTTHCDHPRVYLIGIAHLTARARMLLTIHVKHQVEIQSFHDHRRLSATRQRRQQAAAKASAGGRKQSGNDNAKESCSSGSKNLAVQRSAPSLSTVRTTTHEKLTEEKSRNFVIKFCTTRRLLGLTIGSLVIIEGPFESASALARKRLEFFIVKYPIEQESVQWVVGPKYSNLSALAERTSLHYARYSDTDDMGESRPCIEMCGRAEEIDEAKTMIESHLLYRGVFHDAQVGKEMVMESNQQSEMENSERRGSSKYFDEGFGSRESISSETLAASTIDSMDRSSICGALGP
ncbi:hypothetical protein Pmar_PMAR024090 [Perkinsus marinus ATCC 50983]|uniref:Agenet-like domain-containing protein n=1 Tax=Perkinsus marinus (strain ATCC 50983 / TXsc) TaxID=423536 RepID=C5L6M1_PERM5|nr:hypothetical protein Pmar_PMAR024090 [Perkinsus marinus ATCC 50983]EER07682.1 hypothetical protein Pmar_PMAR024090 [Perkinsus marinus ATCC 50983]|eukprot:XP_002775866.1 hypothetical protein Pmar_PMAR024090 [Perkinsus marinus ATCC 50983]